MRASVWNPGWKPVKAKLDRYECRVGLGYERITGEKDGLEVELGTGIRVENVLATKNLRHGVANFAPGLELRNSVLAANRVDLANTGTIATLSNVTFESGSVNFAVELD